MVMMREEQHKTKPYMNCYDEGRTTKNKTPYETKCYVIMREEQQNQNPMCDKMLYEWKGRTALGKTKPSETNPYMIISGNKKKIEISKEGRTASSKKISNPIGREEL